MRPNIPAKRVIDRFVEYHKRPFTVKDVANDTGLHPKTVRNLLPQLVKEERIRVMLREPNGIIYGKNSIIQSTGIKYDWRPKLHILRHIYQLVEQYHHSEMVVKQSTVSRETVYRYLRVLRAEGCIVKDQRTKEIRPVEFNPAIRWFSEY